MPKRQDIHKVMVIGSGPIVIGQAAEFDYAGAQACRALREEGVSVVLCNSNPATIMTDIEIADRVYIEPLTPEFLERIIERERPDGLLATLGGQTGLNLATELSNLGVLEKYNVELLGTPLSAIRMAEDRECFKTLMRDLGEPVPESTTAEDMETVRAFAKEIGFPLIVRPAYTLGGTGGGIAHTDEQLDVIADRGLKLSMRHQILLERCVPRGWKEIEYEVMRDANDTCITICNMENMDPMGIHTGDSIVVAPSQTLTDREYQMLRTASLRIIRGLGIEGGCNVQLALDPNSFDYYIIEVNPRVSRSSALASKATGYPIARVSAKIAIGLRLDEISNAVTRKTTAAFEPALDYVVVKIPRWPFDKFEHADRTIGPQMKATGEVMAIDRTFESALLKAVRSLEIKQAGLTRPRFHPVDRPLLEEKLRVATDERLDYLTEAFWQGLAIPEIHELTGIDPWFLKKIRLIVETEKQLVAAGASLSDEALASARKLGLPEAVISARTGIPADVVRSRREKLGLKPAYKMVDTCAAEFEAETPYFYSTWEACDDDILAESTEKPRAVVIGSGPIRIGQGIEFDYCSVHAVWALRDAGYEAIIINNNPETVSTDFDTSDRLYFEPLTADDILDVLEREKPEGVILQFGGQTALNVAEKLHNAGIRILGSSYNTIDTAEDREKLDVVLQELGIPRPPGRAVSSPEEAIRAAEEVAYPALVRPSYVLGGRAMEIVYGPDDLNRYMQQIGHISPDRPIWVDHYVLGTEVEVDVVCDGKEVLIPGIMEHIERAGVHSGDSMAVCPPQSLSQTVIDRVVDQATRLALRLDVRGLINIQYAVKDGVVYVLEANPRASRTAPYLSKVTGIPMVRVATRISVGETLAGLGYKGGLAPVPGCPAVKAPVFSFSKLTKVDVQLGPEMKSTGEVMGIDTEYAGALYKAMIASGIDVPAKGAMVITLADRDKAEALPIVREFERLGFRIYATAGTAEFLARNGTTAETVCKISEGHPNTLDLIREGKVDLIINTLTPNSKVETEARQMRRAAVERGIPCLTSLDTARGLEYALAERHNAGLCSVLGMDEYLKIKAKAEFAEE